MLLTLHEKVQDPKFGVVIWKTATCRSWTDKHRDRKNEITCIHILYYRKTSQLSLTGLPSTWTFEYNKFLNISKLIYRHFLLTKPNFKILDCIIDITTWQVCCWHSLKTNQVETKCLRFDLNVCETKFCNKMALIAIW